MEAGTDYHEVEEFQWVCEDFCLDKQQTQPGGQFGATFAAKGSKEKIYSSSFLKAIKRSELGLAFKPELTNSTALSFLPVCT